MFAFLQFSIYKPRRRTNPKKIRWASKHIHTRSHLFVVELCAFLSLPLPVFAFISTQKRHKQLLELSFFPRFHRIPPFYSQISIEGCCIQLSKQRCTASFDKCIEDTKRLKKKCLPPKICLCWTLTQRLRMKENGAMRMMGEKLKAHFKRLAMMTISMDNGNKRHQKENQEKQIQIVLTEQRQLILTIVIILAFTITIVCLSIKKSSATARP